MREIIELIRKHQKIRRILRCESPYFHHCDYVYLELRYILTQCSDNGEHDARKHLQNRWLRCDDINSEAHWPAEQFAKKSKGKAQWRLSFSRAEIVLQNSWMLMQQIV